ncbi:MAG: type IV pili methyl-accepting chemotaxis transducer N-terminal domain-containing protein [Thiovulaceae bacterium]|nr:type IV pili methyl-accepting chemotaxis transducer N-terminal domain-containing protein [Sulfurimonadaceae bacterium]MDD3817098.1 type IV pili methyl-accepting chemotaxis transducer N-terminal domain-containing protein [Sulfurimonadaceae bacterium]
MHSISTKIKWIVLVLSLNLITIIAVNIWLNYDQKNDAKLINIAGKERMLSQKTVLELHRLLVNEEGAYERLQHAREAFNRNFALLRMQDSGFRQFSNMDIEETMQEVKRHWDEMERLIDRYLTGDNNLEDLKMIYNNGTKTLELMDDAVDQYEEHMMQKRLTAYKIQIALSVLSFFIILYMARTVLKIQENFDTFLAHSRTISGAQNVVVASGNELEIACSHIDYFLKNVEETLQSASEAVEKSEAYASSMIASSPEAEALMEQSEDMMIQLTEELHQTANRLNKLKRNLQEAQKFKSCS